MASAEKTEADAELKRLKEALMTNEELMQEAAIKYQDLVAAKEDLTAAIQAHKNCHSKDNAARKV